MFEVKCRSPLDDEWEERDEQIETAAGRVSDFGSANWCKDKIGEREHGWNVALFQQAQELKSRLEEIPEVSATIQEQISNSRMKKFKK